MSNDRRVSRLLMLIYDFPPATGAGVLRPLKFATYLPDFGWEPVVVTVRQPPGAGTDPGLADRIPAGLEVHRTRNPLPRQQSRRLRSRYGGSGSSGGPPRSSVLGLVRDALLVPDARVLWGPFAATAAVRLHRRQPFDAVYATSPPHSVQMIGRRVARLIGRPLVSDFRDPWSHAFAEWRVGERSSRRRREVGMERKVVTAADAVLGVTPGMVEDFRASYPDEPADRFHVVYNGFDPRDYEGVEPHRFPKLAFVYTGKLIDIYSPEPFLRGLGLLLERRPELADRIEVHFLGEHDARYADLVARPPFDSIVTLHGHVDHRTTMAYQLGASVLVSLLQEIDIKHTSISGKIFEYLYAGALVLGVMPGDSAGAGLIREANAGVVVGPGDPGAIANAVETLVEGSAKRVNRPAEGIMNFSRRTQTQTLARILDRCVRSVAS